MSEDFTLIKAQKAALNADRWNLFINGGIDELVETDVGEVSTLLGQIRLMAERLPFARVFPLAADPPLDLAHDQDQFGFVMETFRILRKEGVSGEGQWVEWEHQPFAGLLAELQSFRVLIADFAARFDQFDGLVTRVDRLDRLNPSQPPVWNGLQNVQVPDGAEITAIDLRDFVTDGDTPIDLLVFEVVGLPAGVVLNGAEISGTPTVIGVSNVTLTARDELLNETQVAFTFEVFDSAVPPIVSPVWSVVPARTVGQFGQMTPVNYDQYLANPNGSPADVDISVTGLPAGIVLNNHVLTGSPSEFGTFRIVATATVAGAPAVQVEHTITVNQLIVPTFSGGGGLGGNNFNFDFF